MTEHDDKALLQAIAGGSAEEARSALAALYRAHGDAIARFVAGLMPEDPEREDVVHDVFLRAAANAASFRGTNARPWLLAIAGNRVNDVLRSRRRRRARETRVAEQAPLATQPTDASSDEALATALAALPERWRVAVHLRYVEGLEHRRVADVLGVSLRTAKEWASRGFESLRQAIERLERDR